MSASPTPNAQRLLVECVRRYCSERGLECRSLGDDWLLEIRSPGRSHLVLGYDLGINSSTAAKVANDKSATSELLTANGIAAVPHRVFLHPRLLDFVAADGNWRGLLATFDELGRDAVVKDNEGTGGMEVYRVRTVKELEQRVHGLFNVARAVALSPYLAIEDELRFVLLEGDCVLAYAKERATVTGDGRHSLAELIAARIAAGARPVPLDNPSVRLGEVPATGAVVPLQWRHNLGLGARARPLDPAGDEPEALALARRALAALGLRFASVDVVRADGRLQVMEVNSGVMLEVASRTHAEGTELAQRIYARVLDLALGRA